MELQVMSYAGNTGTEISVPSAIWQTWVYMYTKKVYISIKPGIGELVNLTTKSSHS
jgi:hypothetical protein